MRIMRKPHGLGTFESYAILLIMCACCDLTPAFQRAKKYAYSYKPGYQAAEFVNNKLLETWNESLLRTRKQL